MHEGMMKLLFAGFTFRNEVCKFQDIMSKKHGIS